MLFNETFSIKLSFKYGIRQIKTTETNMYLNCNDSLIEMILYLYTVMNVCMFVCTWYVHTDTHVVYFQSSYIPPTQHGTTNYYKLLLQIRMYLLRTVAFLLSVTIATPGDEAM